MQKEAHCPDSFPREKHLLLSLGAMFESEFSLDWLEELTGMKASEVLSILEEETQNGVLTRKRPAVYLFKNNQKRQEWLDRLAPEEKVRCHRSIAAILIRELPDDDSKALEIAQHLVCIPNDWKGCQWLLRAGEIHARSHCAEKAIACFTQVMRELSNQRGDNEDWLFVRAAIEHSNVSAGRSDALTALSFLHEARERTKSLQKQSYEILLEMHIAKYERLRSEFDKALGRFEEAFSKAEGLGDPELTAATTMFNTYFLFWQGRFRDVIDVYERSVPEVDRYPIGRFPLIAAMMVGHCYAIVGQVTQGLGMLDAIRNYCLQKGDRYLSSFANSSIAMVMLSINRIEDSLRYLKLSLKEAAETGNYRTKAAVTLMLALAYHLTGNKKEACQHLRGFLKHRTEAQANLLLYPYLLELSWAMECRDLPSLPGLSLEQEIDQALKLKNIFIKGIAYRYQALLGKSKGEPNQEIIRMFAHSAKLLKDSGNRIELAKTHLHLTRHYLSVKNDKKAKATMQTASQILAGTNVEVIPDDLRTLIGNQNLEGTILAEIMNLAKEMVVKQADKRLLQQIVTTVNRITGAERGALLLLTEGTHPQGLQLRASKNLTIEQIYDPGFASSRTIIEEVIASGKGRIAEVSPAEDRSSLLKETIRSSICVPLILHRKIIGVLYHENRLLSNVFKESHLKLLTYFAALATLSLDSQKAHEEVERLNRQDKEKDLLPQNATTEPHRFEGIIGISLGMKHILAQIDHVAETDTTVLILGETGVGKSLVAGAIHRQSLRRDGPFVIVQCSALTESLITSELFGHEKGAFTGATDRRIGRFELANKGTLFLDEIGDLSLEVQARLLRVLQSKEFERVGGGKDILTSDFRLIAATNRNLEQEVKAKRFREDLYYRINVVPICIPPLRERREDIPLLVQHFLGLYTSKPGKRIDKIPREVMEALVRHDWPGNIRELENVIQRVVISSKGPDFQLPPLEITQPRVTETDGIRTLKENEREHILQALRILRWKVRGPGGAAEILDINPSTLASRMRKLGIKRPSQDSSAAS
jgi:formate hydrogenlyase transcriptional activator